MLLCYVPLVGFLWRIHADHAYLGRSLVLVVDFWVELRILGQSSLAEGRLGVSW